MRARDRGRRIVLALTAALSVCLAVTGCDASAPDPRAQREQLRAAATVYRDVDRPDHRDRSRRGDRRRLRHARPERLPTADDRATRPGGPQAGRGQGLHVHQSEDLHLHPEQGPAVQQRRRAHLQRRQVLHPAGRTTRCSRILRRTAVVAAPDRHAGSADRRLRAESGGHPVRVGAGLPGRLDRGRAGVRRRRDQGAGSADRRLRPVRSRVGREGEYDVRPVPVLHRIQPGPRGHRRLPDRARLSHHRRCDEEGPGRRRLARAGRRRDHPLLRSGQPRTPTS